MYRVNKEGTLSWRGLGEIPSPGVRRRAGQVKEGGAAIPAGSVSTRFVRYVVGHAMYKGEVTQPERLFGDCLDDAE